MNVGKSSVDPEHNPVISRASFSPRVASESKPRRLQEVQSGRVDFIDAVIASVPSHRSAREQILAEFERRYIIRLDLTYDSEASRAMISEVTPRYLRKLRRRARLHALGQ